MRTQFFAPAVIVAATTLLASNKQVDALKLNTEAQIMSDNIFDDMGNSLAGFSNNLGSMGRKTRAVGAADTGLDQRAPAKNLEGRSSNLGQAPKQGSGFGLSVRNGDNSSFGDIENKDADDEKFDAESDDESKHGLSVTNGNNSGFGDIKNGSGHPLGATKASRSFGDIKHKDADDESDDDSVNSLQVTKGDNKSLGDIKVTNDGKKDSGNAQDLSNSWGLKTKKEKSGPISDESKLKSLAQGGPGSGRPGYRALQPKGAAGIFAQTLSETFVSDEAGTASTLFILVVLVSICSLCIHCGVLYGLLRPQAVPSEHDTHHDAVAPVAANAHQGIMTGSVTPVAHNAHEGNMTGSWFSGAPKQGEGVLAAPAGGASWFSGSSKPAAEGVAAAASAL